MLFTSLPSLSLPQAATVRSIQRLSILRGTSALGGQIYPRPSHIHTHNTSQLSRGSQSGSRSDGLSCLPNSVRSMSTSSATPSAPPKDEKRRQSSGFRYWIDVQTRWSDNDQYGHVNNVVYYNAADAAINAFLIERCGLEPFQHPGSSSSSNPSSSKELSSKDVLGLMISTSAIYFAPASFPSILRVGLRVIKLGSSSVLFEIGIFEKEQNSTEEVKLAAALTRATHVYVDRVNRRPVKPMPKEISEGLKTLVLDEFLVSDGSGGGNDKSKL